MYGKQIKHLVFKKTKKKIAFGKQFFSIVTFLELRLNILIVRMRFSSKLLTANLYIRNKLIYVNGFLRQKNYVVRVSDNVQKINGNLINSTARFFLKKWRLFIWRKWRRRNRFNRDSSKKMLMFWFSKKIVLSLNYLEINYKVLTAFVIRKPVFGEVLISNGKKLLSSTMLKKVYYLY